MYDNKTREVSRVLNHKVGPPLQKIFFKAENFFLVIATVKTRLVLKSVARAFIYLGYTVGKVMGSC